MKRSAVGIAGGLVVAVAVGSVLYRLVGDFALASVTGVIWGSGVPLGRRLYRSYPPLEPAPTWKRGRWVGVGTGLITLAALIGVSPSLPIAADLRVGLGLLVVGTGFVAMVASALAESERVEGSADE